MTGDVGSPAVVKGASGAVKVALVAAERRAEDRGGLVAAVGRELLVEAREGHARHLKSQKDFVLPNAGLEVGHSVPVSRASRNALAEKNVIL